MKTLVLGIGNPILGDDGFGWKVVEALRQSLPTPGDVELDCCAMGGLELIERLSGYDQAILIDAVQASGAVPGQVNCLTAAACLSQTVNQSHGLTFAQALTLADRLSIPLPENITVYTVDIQNQIEFSETLSPAVANSLAAVVRSVSTDLETVLSRHP